MDEFEVKHPKMAVPVVQPHATSEGLWLKVHDAEKAQLKFELFIGQDTLSRLCREVDELAQDAEEDVK